MENVVITSEELEDYMTPIILFKKIHNPFKISDIG